MGRRSQIADLERDLDRATRRAARAEAEAEAASRAAQEADARTMDARRDLADRQGELDRLLEREQVIWPARLERWRERCMITEDRLRGLRGGSAGHWKNRADNCAARYTSALNRLQSARARQRALEDAHRLVKKASASKDVTIGRLTAILTEVAPAIEEIRDLYAKDGTNADLLRSAAHEIRNRRAAARSVTCCRLPLGHAGPCVP